VNAITERFLKLRHRLIPYLYSANYQTHTQGTPICMPLYYRYDQEDAYRAKNQYIFGGQLMVCPITRPADKRLNLGSVDVWLPEGTWTDIFNGRKYRGGRWVTMYRDLDAIPVLAAAGAIVPMYHSADTNDLSLEQPLDIHVWHGSGSFDLYEDDGETNSYQNGDYAITNFTAETDDDKLVFTVTPAQKPMVENRTMHLRFRDIAQADCWVNGEPVPFEESIPLQVGSQPVNVRLENVVLQKNQEISEFRTDILTRVQASNSWKSARFSGKRALPAFLRKALSEADAFE
jgi:alpha-glucosidase (family GH31 glycosyl hydrolase)